MTVTTQDAYKTAIIEWAGILTTGTEPSPQLAEAFTSSVYTDRHLRDMMLVSTLSVKPLSEDVLIACADPHGEEIHTTVYDTLTALFNDNGYTPDHERFDNALDALFTLMAYAKDDSWVCANVDAMLAYLYWALGETSAAETAVQQAFEESGDGEPPSIAQMIRKALGFRIQPRYLEDLVEAD